MFPFVTVCIQVSVMKFSFLSRLFVFISPHISVPLPYFTTGCTSILYNIRHMKRIKFQFVLHRKHIASTLPVHFG
jgi:hypothetical protein